MAVVTKEEILKIANLSKLWVSEEELEALTRDMGEICQYHQRRIGFRGGV